MLKKPLYEIDNVKIYGNNQSRPLYYFDQLPERYKKVAKNDFDWINSSETSSWNEEQFFIYKDQLYCLSDFMAVNNSVYNPNPPQWMKKFDGYNHDSFFSGILIKYDQDDNEYIKVYTYIS
jgi:hypothetical protein